jgi:hypothetical protein
VVERVVGGALDQRGQEQNIEVDQHHHRDRRREDPPVAATQAADREEGGDARRVKAPESGKPDRQAQAGTGPAPNVPRAGHAAAKSSLI